MTVCNHFAMSRFISSAVFLSAALLVHQAALGQTPSATTYADFIVYGGTASGVMTAYSAAREGLHVILLEPGSHLGGMVTGGLSATDLGQFRIIGGYARDFYMQAAAHYGLHDLNKGANWLSEPKVGEAIFTKMLSDAKVEVHFGERLKEHDGILRAGRKLKSIVTMDGKLWQAKVYADCSYEGELMAQAGVTYTYGREPASQYAEDLAGVRAQSTGHRFPWPMSAYDGQHKLLPEISPGPLAAPGSGDKLVQAYNFRVILTQDPADRLPFPRPEHYDTVRFDLLKRYLAEFESHMGRAPRLGDVTNPVRIPNRKADFNNNGPVSTDYIGHSWSFPDASYADKKAIWNDHLNYVQSFFYFLSTDPSVPPSLQKEANEWGLPKDEFQDTGHWPNQLYIRESRRMIGSYIVRQADLQTARTKDDSIGMGSYNSDSHNIQRIVMPDGTVANEGDVQVPVQPYEIPFRTILPERAQAENLLVPVCFSATHAAYSSLRMEPQYMIIGQAAGVAAALSIHTGTAVQDVSIQTLQSKLRAHGAILNIAEAAPIR